MWFLTGTKKPQIFWKSTPNFFGWFCKITFRSHFFFLASQRILQTNSPEIRVLCLMKCYKICHIFGIWKPTWFFISCYDMKKEKTMLSFVFQMYGKFWSILLGHFIKHKSLISEECVLIGKMAAKKSYWDWKSVGRFRRAAAYNFSLYVRLAELLVYTLIILWRFLHYQQRDKWYKNKKS